MKPAYVIDMPEGAKELKFYTHRFGKGVVANNWPEVRAIPHVGHCAARALRACRLSAECLSVDVEVLPHTSS